METLHFTQDVPEPDSMALLAAGLPALAIWTGFIVILARHLWRLFLSGAPRAQSAAGLAAIAAMLTAGLFEYNFGDSEFLMLFLVIVTLPFAATRQDAAAATQR